MKIKVCGLTETTNIEGCIALNIDMLGYNFYPPSSRYVGNNQDLATLQVPDSIQKVGVFVNEPLDNLQVIAKQFNLDYLQLHGDEDPVTTQAASQIAKVIKVFRITPDFDFTCTEQFEHADLFLFDTFTKEYGGSGTRFDWRLLEHYQGQTPFLLAGGISLKDADAIRSINHPAMLGVDINSGFELQPGIKSLPEVAKFATHINR